MYHGREKIGITLSTVVNIMYNKNNEKYINSRICHYFSDGVETNKCSSESYEDTGYRLMRRDIRYFILYTPFELIKKFKRGMLFLIIMNDHV